MASKRFQSIFVLAALALPLPISASELYRRAVVLEDFIGRIQLRSAFGIRLAVVTNCDSHPRGCPAERVYDEVVQILFSSERREVAGDQVQRSETPMGTLYLALSFSDSDLETFRSELDLRLRRLSAEAFREPFAGWGPVEPSFQEMVMGPPDAGIERPASRSAMSAWACFESKERTVVARYDREVEEGPDGKRALGTFSRTYTEPPSPVCAQMISAVESAAPRIIETLPAPQRLLELVVDHEDRVRISPEEEALAETPRGTRLLKHPITKGISCEGQGSLPEDVAYSSYSDGDGWQYSGCAGAAPIPGEALDRDAWLHRFSIETVERRLGRLPQERRVGSSVLFVAYLATLPAAIVEDSTDPTMACSNVPPPAESLRKPRADGPARIDREAFLDEVAERLEFHRGPPQDLIEELVSRPDAGLESEGWISVLCRSDGSADYYLVPTKAHHRLTNPELFCGALETRLGRR